MKLTDLALIFVILTLPFLLLMRIDSKNLDMIMFKKMELNRTIDTAIEDAMESLVVVGEDKKISTNKNKAVKTFYNTLFLNLGIVHNQMSKKMISTYIPIIAVVDYDGIDILVNREYEDDDGYKYIKQMWLAKKTYSIIEKQYVINFTLDDHITIYDTIGEELYVGAFSDLEKNEELSKISFMKNEEKFEQIRRMTITDVLRNEISYSINEHNKIAKQYGISYHFSLPVISEDDWYNAVNDISMMVFFQGYPIGMTDKPYNNYALGGSRVIKPYSYVLQKKGDKFYYHRRNCSEIDRNKDLVIFETKQECARKGGIPCNHCKP